jgi:hypothetical protein
MYRTLHHLSLSWTMSVQSAQPPSHFLNIVLILFSHPCLGLPSHLFISGFPTKTLYVPFSHTCHMLHPSHSSWCDHQNNIWWGEQIVNLCIMQSVHPHITLSLLGPSIFLRILFMNTPSLCSSLNVGNHLLHPYKRKGKMCSSVYFNLYILG